MRKGNKVKQLNRTHSHRKAMLRNMLTSLFKHERIVTTRVRGKVLKSEAEKIITRAKRNLNKEISQAAALHNKREVMKVIRDRAVVVKLFEDIAPRNEERNGGYIRLVHLQERKSDSAKMSIVELVERKEETEKLPDTGKKDKKKSKDKKKIKTDADKPAKDKDAGTETPTGKDTKDRKKKRKWFWGFKKKKGDGR